MNAVDPVAGLLTAEERREVSLRLTADLAGAGLLSLGLVWGWLRPDQAQVAALVQAVAALVVGVPVLARGARGLITPSDGSPAAARSHTDQLVALAVVAAMAIGDFFTAALVPLVLDLGRLFEERSALGAQAAVEGIRRLRAHTATLLGPDGQESQVDPATVPRGARVRVRPGQVVPVDGTVVAGRANVDQSAVTGESTWERVTPGSEVFAGTVDLDGLLEVEVTRAGEATVLGRVVELLRAVEASRTPALRLLERLAGAWLPVALTLAATVLFFTEAPSRAIAVLVVACPTAVVLAGPAAMVAAMTVCTRLQILIKNAAFLERVAEVDTLLLDKTGTVTLGAQGVVGEATDHTLRLGLAAARASLHPVSRALVVEGERRGLVAPEAVAVTERAGLGVVAETVEGVVRVGRRALLAEGRAVPEGDDPPGAGAWVAVDQTVLGWVGVADRVRDGAPGVIQAMRALGIRRVLLVTGDKAAVAGPVGEALGVDGVVAEVLPEQKLDVVRAEQAAGRVVLMLGDGVNDALALSGADVGVAIGARVNEVALGGADVAFLTDDLTRLPLLVQVADRTRRVMTSSAVLGLTLSGVTLALAAGGVISPLVGALLHNAGALLVVLNSTRLLGFLEVHGRA